MRQVLESEAGRLVIPAPVAAEVDYLVRWRGGREAGRRFLEDLAMGRMQVESLSLQEHGLALAVNDRHPDLELSRADLAVVVLAHRHRTRRILSFDERGFRALEPIAGGSFVILPADADVVE